MNKEFEALIESEKYATLDETQKNTLAAVMENTQAETERMIAEGTIAADIAQFTPFLMPMLRKVYPALIANELLGVQPLAGPTGFIYSLTNRYVGSAANGITGKPGNDTGLNGPHLYDKTNAATQVLLIAMDAQGTVPSVGDTIEDPNNSGVTVATVVYVEPANHGSLVDNYPQGQTLSNTIGGAKVGGQKPDFVGVLVELAENGYWVNGGISKVLPDYVLVGTNTGVVANAFTGLAAFDKILPNFSGTYTTSAGEVRGTVGNEMSEVGIAVERTQIEAMTRKLRAEYTIEMYQDLKAMHGVLADQELMNLMSYEIKAETDREIVDFVNRKALLKGDYYLNGGYGHAVQPGDANVFNAGRWEIERYRALGIKLADESREIGRRNKRGAANKLLISPKVLTVLEALGGFQAAPINSTANANSLNPVAGRFDNKFSVVVDNYADQGEYATLIYKGSNQDSMGVYAPYTPVQIQKVNHITTGQPALIAMSRYGVGENPWGGHNYATTFGINFDVTTLG